MCTLCSISVPGVIGVNKRTLGLGVIIVLVVILLGLPGSVHSHGVGAVLSAAGNVVPSQDPGTSEWSHIYYFGLTIKLDILMDYDAVESGAKLKIGHT